MKENADLAYLKGLHSQRQQLLQLLRSTDLTQLKEGIPHQQIVPWATYSPWSEDKDFMSAYEQAKGETLVDIYRCYELWTLALRTANVDGDIAEIGVWRGGTAAILASANEIARPGTKIHLFDTFTGVVKADTSKDTIYQGGEHADTSEAVVLNLMSRLKLSNFSIHSGLFPEVTGDQFPPRIRLCHIDVDTYGSAKACLSYVWPRVTTGGVVVFDDYGIWGCEGVTQLVNNEAPPDSLLIHNLNGHGILIKVAAP